MKICLTYSDLSYEKMLNIDTLHCLHSLKWQFDKKDIQIYYTPPQTDKKFEEHISQFGTIVKKPRFEIPYAANLPMYQDRFWVTDIKDEQAIFSDADIEFSQTKKISDLFTDDFDLCGVVDGKWVDDIKFLYAGHILLYDNYYHQKIKPYLLEVAPKIVSGEIPHFDYDRIVDEYMVTYITEKHFKGKLIAYDQMPWAALNTKEESENAYITHGSGRKVFCIGNPGYAKDAMSESLYALTWENKETVGYKHILERLVACLITLIEEDNPDLDLYCELPNANTISINFENIETTPKLLQKFSYLWVPWVAQFKQFLNMNIVMKLK